MSDREAVNLVFLPGLSTAERVTNISGRGVGMDVVKTNIEKIGGAVDVVSRQGEGTTVKIKIPLTLAIIPGLVVNSGLERYVIPQVSLQELVRLEGEQGRRQIELIKGTPVYRRRGSLLPIAYLCQLLGRETLKKDSDVTNIVVLHADGCEFGLVVDGINDTQEIVVKPLGKQLKGLNAYAGATIMGDGRVALILDVHGLAEMSGVLNAARDHAAKAEAERERREQVRSNRQSYLVFRAGSFQRLAVPLSLVARLEEFPLSRVEHAAGRLVVQYRGQLLRLVPLAAVLEQREFDASTLQDPVQVVVFSDRDRVLGLLVDQVVDILDDTIEVRQTARRLGLAGSAVVGKRVTDFVDLASVFEAAGEDWFGTRGQRREVSATVMVADASAFSRALVKNSLELMGHRVVEAASAREALAAMEKQKVDVVVADVGLPDEGSRELLHELRTRPALAGVAALGLTTSLSDPPTSGDGFDDYLVKYDREGMMRAIVRATAAREEEEPELAVERS